MKTQEKKRGKETKKENRKIIIIKKNTNLKIPRKLIKIKITNI